ncbi:non-ribosomal peptide synthetase [Streptomyces sp. Tu 3180]|uniref:non-ribosomal peptide synthetase n=1 Tax=Streptomyces sp. Tu 3180 TaxID=2682611 RepID=UPI0013573AD7|nr:non-ribosomal peptide synthetase [Streptomyces sp. Tu 3180]KAF3468917.1 amino acid adenylation domain-containing protein [Streptomyces sp. Tu 3180]
MEATTSGDVPCTSRTTTLCLPRLSEDASGARLLRTYREPGERFRAGEPLYECETDKVTVDVDAPVDGELESWLVSEGAAVEADAPVARIRVTAVADEGTGGADGPDGTGGAQEDGADRADGTGTAGSERAEETGSDRTEGTGPDRTGREVRTDGVAGSGAAPDGVRGPGGTAGPDAAGRTGDTGGTGATGGTGGAPSGAGRVGTAGVTEPALPPADARPVRVSPLARKHARLRGLSVADLASIPRRGSMLTPADIDRHLDGAGSGREPAGRSSEDPPDYDDVPLTEAQQRLNRALDRAREEVTASSVSLSLDAAALRRAAARLRVESGAGFVSDFQALVRLAALAARDHARLRARRIGADGLRVFRRTTVGVAVATAEADLVVAGLPGAGEGTFGEFSARWADALESALAGRSTVDGTATLLVSSLDEEGALDAAPVVVPPAVATLFLGAAAPGPDGSRLLTLAYDHGVLNGREATRYLADVRRQVERLAGAGPDTGAPATAGVEPAGPPPAGTASDRAFPPPAPGPAPAHGVTLTRLTELVREVTGCPVDADRPFAEQGLTSSGAVRLASAVGERWGVRLPATAVWHHPTPRALAAAVDARSAAPAGVPTEQHAGAAAAVVPDAPAATPAGPVPDGVAPPPPGDRAVIVGMACAFPGAEGPEAFWRLLEGGGCAVREVPAGRLADFVPDAGGADGPPPRAGLLDAPGDFDAAFFGIPPRQARSMDPQQRLLLELSHHALEDAGLVPGRLAGTRTGVFVGTSSYDFRERTVREGRPDGYATLGTFPAFLANRISYHYDLTGPSITVDTACSASLTALVLAVSAIERGECETALVGGVNLLGSGFNQAAFQRAGMLSSTGLSRAFDAAADGYVRGEGAGWLVLRSLRRAEAEGDPLLAVVRGASANHGGRAAGPTAPSPRAQTRLIRDALARAGLRGHDLGYVEAHGTGTPLGDPVELEALRAALEADGVPSRAAGPGGRVAVGSVKANIGHLEGAAGLAGVVKTVLAMRHAQVPPMPHFTRLNPAIDLSGSVLRVADRALPWPAGDAPRRAAVSSFGIGGSNAHVVLEQVEVPAAADGPGPYVLPLSVATPDALPVLARRLAGRLADGSERGGRPSLAAWARTLQTGRAALPVRAALTVRDTEEAREALLALAEGRPHPAVTGPAVAPDGVGAREAAANGSPVRRWLDGEAVDWTAAWNGPDRPRRVSLPGHPFDRRPLPPPWADGPAAAAAGDRPPGPSREPGPRAPEPEAAPESSPPPSPSVCLAPRWVPEPLPDTGRHGPAAAAGVVLVHDASTEAPARSWARRWPSQAGAAASTPVLVAYGGGLPDGLPEGPVRVLLLVGGADWTADADGHREVRRWLRTLVRLARALDTRGYPAAVTLVTTGLAVPGGRPSPGAALQGTLLGALRSLPHESGLLTAAAVDLPGFPADAPTEVTGAAEAAAEPCGTWVPLVSHGHGRRLVERLTPVAKAADPGGERGPWPAAAPALIVFGGAGGVGGTVAVDLAARRRARLLLVGRSAPDERVAAVLRGVRDAGGDAEYLVGDVRDEADVSAAFARCVRLHGRVDGVLHTAGAAENALLHDIGEDALGPLLDVKVDAVATLHRVRSRHPGTPLVLFSSFLATFGSQGGLGYAAANACLDRVAAALDGPDTPTRAVGWGLWRDTGMARDHGGRILAAFPGLRPLDTDEATRVLERCLAGPHPHVVVPGGRPRALEAFLTTPGPHPDDGPAGDPAGPPAAHTTERPARRPEADTVEEPARQRPEELEERIRSVVRAVLGAGRPLPPALPWRELGVDSLLHVELTSRLGEVFGPLPGTTLHEHGTIEDLARHLAGRAGVRDAPAAPEGAPATAPEARPRPAHSPVAARGAPPRATGAADAAEDADAPLVPAGRPPARPGPAAPGHPPAPHRRTPRPSVPAGAGRTQPPVAVIGLAGRYPGAPDPDSLWRLLSEGRSPVREVPEDRWDWRVAHVLDPGTTRWGCFLEDWDRFDAESFRIPPRDAAVLDPQERQFLETAWETFESAGYAPSALSAPGSPHRVGVYVGVTSPGNLLAQRDARLTGADNAEYGITAFSSVANRVSYALGLTGPSLAVDTMCSASLTAVHLACQALATGDADLALAGGVHLLLHPDRFGALGAVGMTSKGPRTRAFGAGGDGFVPGEGAGAVLLKPLERAEADGDTVYAVITGSSVNHGGRGSGYTVPNPVAQSDLVLRALERAGTAPHTVGYVEAHGTGTELGDPIELRALTRAFTTDERVRPHSVRIGSVKANIGHGEAVAGVAGLTKAILQLRHRRLVPSPHARPENPLLELAGSPFRVQHTAEAWQAAADEEDGPVTRRAAVSSFGAGGANAHVVLEEYRAAPDREDTDRPCVVPLAAPDTARLAESARRLAAALSAPAETLTGPAALRDIAATLAHGRADGPCRAAVVCADRGTLVEALEALAAGAGHPALVTEGTDGEPPAGVTAHEAAEAWRPARRWVRSGASARPAPSGPYRRVALPATPFGGGRHRVPRPATGAVEAALLPLRRGRALPLVAPGGPVGDRVPVALPAGHPWVTDHVVDGSPLLPGALAVEAVLEALLALGTNPYGSALEDVTFLTPWAGRITEAEVVLGPAGGDGTPDGAPGTGGRRPFTVRAGETELVRGGVAAAAPPRPLDGLTRYAPDRLAAALAPDGAEGGADDLYAVLEAHGFSYGAGYRAVRTAVRSGGEVVAALASDGPAAPAGRPALHPAVLDGAFQAAGYGAMAEAGLRPVARFRPFSVDRVVVHRPAVGPVYAHVRPVRLDDARGVHVFDLSLVDEAGVPVADVDGFLLRSEPLTRRPATVAPAPGAGRDTGAYALEWRPAGENPGPEPADLLVIGGDGPLCRALRAGAGVSLPWEALPPGEPEAARERLERALEGLAPDAGVLLVLDGLPAGDGFPAGEPDAALDAYERFAARTVQPVFAALRALVCARRLASAQVRIVACCPPAGAEAVQHALYGLVRTVAGETGRFGAGLVTVDRAWCAAAPDEAAAAVRGELGRTGAPSWTRPAADGRVDRAEPVEVPRAASSLPLRPDGCYLVVGGTGGLGRAVARSVLRREPGARVVVAGRRTRPPGEAETGRVTYLPCDVTDPEAVAGLAGELDRRGLRVAGVVFAAGVLRDGFLRTKTPAAVDDVVRVKALGAVLLDAALVRHPLDFFALASSVAVHVGNQGQSDYAFANGFLDGFAEDRARLAAAGLRPGRTLSVGWPVLEGGGMRPSESVLAFLRETYGLAPLPVTEAAEELWRLLACAPPAGGPARVVVAHGDLGRWAGATGARPARGDGRDRTAQTGAEPVRETRAEPETEPAGAHAAAVRWLTAEVSAVTGLAEAALAPDTPLDSHGVDSIALMRLARRLEGSLGRLPRSTLHDHDTIADLARALAVTHGSALASASRAASGGAPPPRPAAVPAGPASSPDTGAWPLTERLVPLWTAEQVAAPRAPYNLSVAWRLPAGQDRHAVGAAVTRLVALHPVLGRAVGPHSGTLRLLTPAADRTASGLLDVRGTAAGRLHDALVEESARRLPLDSGPALRAVLWDDGTGRDVLQVTVHHLVADGRSVELLGEDLGALCRDPEHRRAPGGSFGAFLAQEEEGAGAARAQEVRAWSDRLRDAPPAPRFPGGAPGAGDWAAGHAEYRMPGPLRDRLRALADRAGVSAFTVHLAAYALAVCAVTGSGSLLVAVPTYGRPDREYDRTVGNFVNSVPVRVRPVPELPLRRWLAEVQEEVRSALALAAVPYPSVAELCRGQGGEAAVPTLTFAYQNWPRPADAPRPPGERVFIRGQGGHWDLGLELTDTPDGVEVLANHRLTALTDGELDSFVDTWFTLAGALGADPDAPTGDLLGADALTLHGRFRRVAARRPQAEAVRDATGSLSYAEVDRRSAAVARAVRDAGARPGDPVAVLVRRGVHLPVALLGVLRAGCPYVPLDASYPPERLRSVLRDAGCAVAVTERSAARAAEGGAGPLDGGGPLRTVLLDDLPAAPPDEDRSGTGAPDPDGGPDPLAYLMFTSGSTGRPKGVAVGHRNVLHTLDAFRDLLGWSGRDRLMAVTTAGFDISVLELFLPLVTGATVVVADREAVRDPARLGRLLDEEDITVLQATPSGWRLLLDSGWRGRPGLTALCGGEPLPPSLAGDLAARVGALWNVYGPTEATIWSTAARLTAGAPVVLGEPVGATELLLVSRDADGAPSATPDGGTGELYIGGPGVAAGYWRRPGTTAERFTGHPLLPGRAGRWFRTGDLVRRAPDGGLCFVGRADGQVKIRGHRLELGEVEAVLADDPRVGQAVAVTVGEGPATRLAAVVTPAAGAAVPSAEELRASAARRLPEWMVPGTILVRDALPVTPNGKTDRAALARLAAGGGPTAPLRDGVPGAPPVDGVPGAPPAVSGTGGPYGTGVPSEPGPDGVPPVPREDELSRRLAEEWGRLLGVDRVPPDREFFSLGGNSVLIGSLFARLSEGFPDARLELADLFAHPTLADQVRLLTGRLAAGPPGREHAGESAPPPAGDGAHSADDRNGPPSAQQLRRERRRSARRTATKAG